MKKFLSILLLVGSTFSIFGQQFKFQSFLNEFSLTVSNTFAFTNLSSIGVLTTNVTGAIYTNFQGTRVICTNADTHNSFVDIPLWTDRNGNWPAVQYTPMYTNVVATYQDYPQSVYVKLIGQSGANSAVTFVAFPIVFDDKTGTTKEINAAGTTWTFAVTANTTTPVTLLTNVPAHLWRGAQGIRINRVVNGDVDATSNATILDLALVGWVP